VNKSAESPVSLVFPLNVEDDWPPVASESLPFRRVPEGYVVLVPPLFVKNLSVGDVIGVQIDEERRQVVSWHYISQSGHTTMWLLRLQRTETINRILAEFRALGCNTVGLDDAGAYAIDIPDSVPIGPVDAVLAQVDNEVIAVAFPSMRHTE